MLDHCTNLRQLASVQSTIIKKHIDKHKWFAHIVDKQQATSDFIEKFGWIMRELYCGYICEKRLDCSIASEFLPQADSK
ncbi:MAG: hypothetical protein WC460_05790 [Patescibacteria group bacterium]